MVEPQTPEREVGGSIPTSAMFYVLSLSKDTFTPRKELVIPRKRWLFPYKTEKLFTGTLSLDKTKQQAVQCTAISDLIVYCIAVQFYLDRR